jgi:hypothetical protein
MARFVYNSYFVYRIIIFLNGKFSAPYFATGYSAKTLADIL